ncbi:unnamed protein product [Spodoptera exigua]|nr:unnamed protein product [Spodoptera exigua]
MVNVLRVSGMQMTELDDSLTQYKKLTTLNLCTNWLTELNAKFLPLTLKALELHNNCISDISGFADSLPIDLLYLGLSRNMLSTGWYYEFSRRIGTATTGRASDQIHEEESSHGSDIYSNMVPKNSREIHNYTTFESTKVQWNKLMTFNEPVVKIFCPDLVALRDTFRSTITVRLVYTVLYTPAKTSKGEKQKSIPALKTPAEMRVNVATIRCSLRAPDWSQQSQHFHWDETLGTNDAIHWGDGDLAVLQYSQAPVKVTKGKMDGDMGSRQSMPEFLTCHFGFGIDTLRTT